MTRKNKRKDKTKLRDIREKPTIPPPPRIEPGEQIGIRLAHNALAEATQSSLSAFHNAGMGEVVSRQSPSLQCIMDGTIRQSSTSMVVKMDREIDRPIVRRKLKYYVNGITNSLVDERLGQDDFWYDIGSNLGLISQSNRTSSSIVFRFHFDYSKMVNDLITLEYISNIIFDNYNVFRSPNFLGLLDVHLVNNSQMSGLMGLLEKDIGLVNILDYKYIPSNDGNTIITTGSNMGEILGLLGVDGVETISNNILDIEKTLGLDAAREVIYEEIFSKTKNKDTAALIADFMTCKGSVSFFKKDNPILKERGFLSSIAFERPKQDIKRVLSSGIVDPISSIYSQIIVGKVPEVGSGSRLFSLKENELFMDDWDV